MTDIPQKHSALAYRADIDGLRAVAVLLVIGYHLEIARFHGGFVGVDVFFVISGFLISSVILAQISTSTFSIVSFYERRIRRIFPALIVMMFITSVLAYRYFLPTELQDFAKSLLAATFSLSNFYFWRHSGYFDAPAAMKPLLHTWSLGVEEQFYIVFPLFLVLVRRLFPNRLRQAVVVIALVSFAISAVGAFKDPVSTFYLAHTRAWELLLGTILSLKLLPEISRPLLRNLAAALGLVLIVAAGYYYRTITPFPGIAALAPCLGAALIIAAGQSGTSLVGRALSLKPMVFIGLISYSLYLWHWGVLSLSRWSIGIHWWSVPFQAACMFLLAAMSYRFIETPLRRSSWSGKRLFSVGYGLSASAAGYALLLVLSQPMDGRLYLGRLLGISAPANLQRTWWMDKTTGKYLEKCHVKEGFSSDLIKECLEVAAGKRGTLYLIGDSHARNYLPALRDAFREHSTAYLTMGSGCAFLPPAMSSKFARVRCTDYVAETAQYLLQRVHSGDVVFAGQRLSGAEDKQTPLYVDFIKAFAVRLGEKGVPLVLLDGIYPAELGPEQCIELPWRPFRSEGCSAAFETVQKAFARFDRLALDASTQVANLFYAPLRTGLCHEGACGQATATGLPIWHDRSHITEGAAAELAPLLRMRLAQQGFFQRFPAEP